VMSIIHRQYPLRQHTGIRRVAVLDYPIRLSAAGT
jgi:hypothetical protein